MTQKKLSLPMGDTPVWSPSGTQEKAPIVSPEDGKKVLAERTIPDTVYRVGEATPEVQSIALGSARASNTVQSPEDINELARALKNDVDLIFQHVRNQIDYSPMQGLQKGAWGCLVDGIGGPFDQAKLMVDLLRAAGHTADFVFGEIDISNAQVSNWLGTDPASIFNAAFVLAEAGIFNTPYDTGGNGWRIEISHIWVKVDIGGTEYHFDPSFKTYTYKTGIDLGTAMGYDQAALLADAAVGATVDTNGNWVEDVNKANIDTKLTGYSTALVNWINTNNPTATLDDILGGRTLDQVTTQVRDTEHPYLKSGSTPTIWTDIPDTYRILVEIDNTLTGIDQEFFADELYGRRLTVWFNSSIQPELRLDGTLIQTGSAVGLGSQVNFTIHYVHPYPTTTFDEFANVRLFAPYTAGQGGGQNYYTIGLMFGTPQKGLIDVQEKELAANRAAGGSEPDEDVLGVRLGILWNTFAAENARNADLLGRMTNCIQIMHHWAAAVSYDSNRDAGVFDLSNLRTSQLSLDGNSDNTKKFMTSWAMHANSLERLAIQQLAGNKDGFSGSSLLEVANADGTRIYRGTNATWATDVFPNINTASYGGLNLNSIVTPWITNGWIVLLPQDGDQTIGSITTDGWNFQHPDGGAAGFLAPVKGGICLWGESGPCKCKECEEEESDPVGLQSGAYKYRQTDITVGSSAYPYQLSLELEYSSSQRHSKSSLGYGWSHNWENTLVEVSESFRGLGSNKPQEAAATIVEFFISLDLTDDADPAIIKMLTTWLANSWWCDQLTLNVVSAEIPDGSAEFVIMPDGSYKSTNHDGWTLSLNVGEYTITSPQQVAYTFNTDKQLKTVVFPHGLTITLTYSSDKLTSVTNGMGRTLTFTYTGDRLTSVSDGNGRSVSYAFDVDDQLISITNVMGEATSFTYLGLGQIESYFLPENPAVAMVTNTYDTLGRVKSQLTFNGYNQNFYFAGWRTEFENALNQSIVRIYDSMDNTISEIDEAGYVTDYEYDGLNRVTRKVVPEGDSMSWTYDSRDNVLTEVRSPKPGSGQLDIVETLTYDATYNKVATHQDGRGNTTTYTYDLLTGNLLTLEYPMIGVDIPTITFTYNNRGQILTREDESGMLTKFDYDVASEVLQQVTVDEGVGRLNLVTTLGYNAYGDVTSLTDPLSNETKLSYNPHRQLTQIENASPFSYLTNFTYDKNGNKLTIERQTGDVGHPWQVIEATYNAANQVLSLKDPQNNLALREYDELDRIWKVTDADNRITEFQYDPRSFIDNIITPDTIDSQRLTYTGNGLKASVEDGKGNVTLYSYDGFDRPSTATYPDGTFEQSQYDENDNVVSKINRAGETTTFVFDVLDRMVEKTPFSMPVVTFEYDLAGRLTKAKTPLLSGNPASGEWKYGYDTAGRVISEESPDGKIVSSVLDGKGNVTRMNYPDGYFVERAFDELSRLTSIKLNGASVAAVAFDYDELSRRTRMTFDNNTHVDYGYGWNDQMSSIAHSFSGANLDFGYGYSDASQLISQTVSDSQYVRGPKGSKYIEYQSNDMNQYDHVTSSTGQQNQMYNANGCLTSDGIWTFAYDSENQLISANDGTTHVDYVYDPMHQQIQKDVDGTKTRFVYAGWQRIAEYDGDSDVLQNRFVYGVSLDEPLIQVSASGTMTYLHADKQGSVVATTDNIGQVVNSYAYSAWGESDSMSGTSVGYTGQRYDEDTGLYYYKNRYYSPAFGRFLQPDPFNYVDGLNLYSYVKEAPTNFVDPLGLQMVVDSHGHQTLMGTELFERKTGAPVGQNTFQAGCVAVVGFYLGINPGSLPESPHSNVPGKTKCWWGKKSDVEPAKKKACAHKCPKGKKKVIWCKQGHVDPSMRGKPGSEVDDPAGPWDNRGGLFNYSVYFQQTNTFVGMNASGGCGYASPVIPSSIVPNSYNGSMCCATCKD